MECASCTMTKTILLCDAKWAACCNKLFKLSNHHSMKSVPPPPSTSVSPNKRMNICAHDSEAQCGDRERGRGGKRYILQIPGFFCFIKQRQRRPPSLSLSSLQSHSSNGGSIGSGGGRRYQRRDSPIPFLFLVERSHVFKRDREIHARTITFQRWEKVFFDTH